MKSFKLYTESWGSLTPSESLEVGDTCIYLRNGNLNKEIIDFDEDMRSRTIKTVMSPDYFDKKCKIIAINQKIWSLYATYTVEFLHNKKITICKANQLKKANPEILKPSSPISLNPNDIRLKKKSASAQEDYTRFQPKPTGKSGYKSDTDIKLQIFGDTKDGKIKWQKIHYLDRTITSYKATVKIPKVKAVLKFEVYTFAKEWILKVYFEKEGESAVLVRNIKNAVLVANEIQKLEEFKEDKNIKDDTFDYRKGLPDSMNN